MSSAEILRSASHGTSFAKDDPRYLHRKEQLNCLRGIQDRLNRRKHRMMFTEEELNRFSISLGAEFDIDNDSPLDLEPRFFLPGCEQRAASAMHRQLQKYPWRTLKPLNLQHNKETIHDCQAEALSRCDRQYNDASYNSGRISEFAEKDHDWIPHLYNCKGDLPFSRKRWEDSDGEWVWHCFSGNYMYMRPHPTEYLGVDYSKPHAIATSSDSVAPKPDCVLRSELLTVIGAMKAAMRQVFVWLEHHTCPVLIVSFHGRFSARIIQGHLENKKIVLRISRIVNMHVKGSPPDATLLVRWVNSTPVGNTQNEPGDDSLADAAAEEDSDGCDGPQSHGIKVGG